MSSFGENFERDDNKEVQFDSNAFYPFLASAIIITAIYCLYKIYSILFKQKVKFEDLTQYRNCQCPYCKKRLEKIIKSKRNKNGLIFYIGLLTFLVLSFSMCYKKIMLTKKDIKRFNPFEILEIEESATTQQIKKAYKKLAITYHPDKNPNNLQARAKFMLITKAYESLTNEEAKKNFEMYGNPDGPGGMRFSVGLPSFILDKKNHFKILLIFLFFICGVIPYYFFRWYRKTKIFDENGLLNVTQDYFKKCTDLNSINLNIPYIIGTSHEFQWIKDEGINSTTGEITDLFYKFKEYFPGGNNDIEKINSKLNIKNKKAIAICYAYILGEQENENYKKLKEVDKYLILLAKLLDAFWESQKEKLFLYQLIKNPQIAELMKEKITFPPIKREFLHSVILFQQCFYQGIPINQMRENISYVQLPYITHKNMDLITKSTKNMKFRNFLKLKDEEKKIFLKTIFNFSEEEINDIIIATHSIPQYEYKIKKFVDGFEDTEFVIGDRVSYQFTITRKNVGKLNLGVGHSKHFPGLFNECIYITILNGENVISQEKVLIDKKVNEYTFKVDLGTAGTIPFTFSIMSSAFYGMNEVVNSQIETIAKGEKRTQMLKDIDKRKVKPPLSYFQEALKEAGLYNDSDDEEEEEEEKDDEKKKENTDNTENKDIKDENKDNKEENKDNKDNINTMGEKVKEQVVEEEKEKESEKIKKDGAKNEKK